MKAKRKKKPELSPKTEALAPVMTRPPWWLHFVVLAALGLTNLALYQGALRLDFLSVDDPDYVQNNPYIESFKPANLKFILTRPYAANYAPANLLSYAVDVAVAGGKRPTAFHVSNVLWHCLVVWSVYLLAFTIRPAIFPATAASVMFMAHPAHVEVVAWISSRKDLVATVFAVLAMTCYLLARRKTQVTALAESPPPDRQGEEQASKAGARVPFAFWGWYLGGVFCFLLASAAKQSVLLLPAVMLAWDWLVERRRGWRMIADKVPFGLVTLFFGWMTWHAQPSTNQASSVFVLASTELTNLWLLTGLGQYTLYRVAPSAAGWGLAARVGIIAAAVLAWGLPLIWLRFRRPMRAVFCYWVLIQMIPPMLLSFIVPITDRYLFLPSVGVSLLLSDLLFGSAPSPIDVPREADARSPVPNRVRLGRGRRVVAGVAVGMFCIFMGIKTWAYVAEWGDPRSVWYGAHFKTRNAQVAQFLGEVYQNAGDRVNELVKSNLATPATNEMRLARAVLGDEAERLVAEWQHPGGARTNTAVYRDKLWELAWQQYQEAVARRGTLSTPNLFMNRGRLLVSEGKSERAIPEFQAALTLAQSSSYDIIRQETSIHALRAIGTAYWHLRNYQEALQWFLRAQDVQRKSGRAWISTLDDEVRRVQALAGAQP